MRRESPPRCSRRGEPGARGREGESLRPLQNDDGGGGEHVLQAESFEVVERLDAVEVGVIDLGGFAVDMDEGESGLVTSSSRRRRGRRRDPS